MDDGFDPLWLLVGFLIGRGEPDRASGHQHGQYWHEHPLPAEGWHDHPWGLNGPTRVLPPPRWWIRRRLGWSCVRWTLTAAVLVMLPHPLLGLIGLGAGLVAHRRYGAWAALRDDPPPEPGVQVVSIEPDR